MRILLASTYVPFHDGQSSIAGDLSTALQARGFQVDTVLIPLHHDPVDIPAQILAVRLLDVTESCGNRIDRLITLCSPSCALNHPDKVSWCVDSPELSLPANDTPELQRGRDVKRQAVDLYLRECRKVFASTPEAAEQFRTVHGVTADGVLPVPGLAAGPPVDQGRFDWDHVVEVLTA